MPLYMRLPKRGFNNLFANDFGEINLGRLQKAIDARKIDPAQKITREVLEKAGVARGGKDGIRLLGKGALTAKIEIELAGASAGARAAVEKAGGTVVTTFKKPVYSTKKGSRERRPCAAPRRRKRKPRARRSDPCILDQERARPHGVPPPGLGRVRASGVNDGLGSRTIGRQISASAISARLSSCVSGFSSRWAC